MRVSTKGLIQLPSNVIVGDGSILRGEALFKRYHSRATVGVRVGQRTTLDGVHLAVGPNGAVEIGDWCFLSNVVLLCDLALKIGNYVRIGWNTTIADTDFHPLDPDLRIQDAVACSPLADGRPRPQIHCAAVAIEDDVFVGPQVTILKGVRIGRGAFVEAGSVVTRDVPAGTRIMGNPARPAGEEAA
jgi:acetyltransferase-like isoleucine patch superfamily enzyme